MESPRGFVSSEDAVKDWQVVDEFVKKMAALRDQSGIIRKSLLSQK
jgi:hypothetical protein